MGMTPKELYTITRNPSYSVEVRVSGMFVAVSTICSFLGLILCILINASPVATVSVLVMGLLTVGAFFISSPGNNFAMVRNTLLISLLVTMPLIYVGAGGMNSGCPAWLIYALLFIALSCEGKRLHIALSVSFVSDIILFILEYNELIPVKKLDNPTDKFISIFGSCWIVAMSIIFTILLYKRIYNQEQQSLEEKTKELEEKNNFERDFLATMSHELRTPINAILGFNEMILEESSEKNIVSYATDVRNSSDFLLSLINDILDYSKIDAGKMMLVKDTYNIADLMTKCYNVVSARAEDHGLALVAKADPEMPGMLYGDEGRLFQIIVNLLTNAIKYTDEGVVTFSVSAERPLKEFDDNGNALVRLKILVSDTGIGIEQKYIDSIFSSFSRINSIHNKQIEGTGLGLAIVKSLVEIMGGEICVESVVGVGSKFIVYIEQPVVAPEPIGEVIFGRRIEIPDSIVPESPSETRVKKVFVNESDKEYSILAVDDTDTNLRVLKMLLKNEDYRIVTVNNGFDAVEFAVNNDYDLILMDIMMPKMGGVEAMEKIREQKPEAKIIALTADAVAGAREEYLKKGFNDYLTKPLNSEKLKKMIGKYLI